MPYYFHHEYLLTEKACSYHLLRLVSIRPTPQVPLGLLLLLLWCAHTARKPGANNLRHFHTMTESEPATQLQDSLREGRTRHLLIFETSELRKQSKSVSR